MEALRHDAGRNERLKGDQRQFGDVQQQQGGVEGPARKFANIRVNDPSLDSHQTDQTTQNEPSIAVAGKSVAVGFNDSQQALLSFTGRADRSGYAYSSDGGATFTDGGTLPNPEKLRQRRRPLACQRPQRGDVGNLEIAVAKSIDGGRNWKNPPSFASPHRNDMMYTGDKDALIVGPDPAARGRDVLYDTWDDMSCQVATFTCTNGLPVSRSGDGGHVAFGLASRTLPHGATDASTAVDVPIRYTAVRRKQWRGPR